MFRWKLDSYVINNNEHLHCHCCGHEHHTAGAGTRILRIIEHTWKEFIGVAGFLFIGAGISALFRSSIPIAFLGGLKSVPGLSTVFMMAVAFILNLCSEADAFIAGSFASLFSAGPLLAFMLIGPMLDIKLLVMYRTVFKPRLILWLALVIIISVFLWTSFLDFAGLVPELRR